MRGRDRHLHRVHAISQIPETFHGDHVVSLERVRRRQTRVHRFVRVRKFARIFIVTNRGRDDGARAAPAFAAPEFRSRQT